MAGLYSDKYLKLTFELSLDGAINTYGDWYLSLYTNNFTPVVAQIPADYTECAVAGYAAIAIPIGSWAINTTGIGASAVMTTQVFTFLAATTLYGYYFVDGGDLIVMGAELFAGGPIVFGAGGGTLTIDITLILQTP